MHHLEPRRPGTQSRSPSDEDARALRLLQLTDLHLYRDPEGRLLGQKTRLTFERVLDLAQKAYWPVDRILLTGDLVHDESPEGYRFLQDRLASLATPCSSLPGNHDRPSLMAETLDQQIIGTDACLRHGVWNLIFLDSTIPGEEGGHLPDDQLHSLSAALEAHPRQPALVCLHHQPLPIGSRWLDTMALDNPEAFFAILDRHPQVRGILWGHIHQEYRGERRGVALLATPSTCIQFLPRSEGFAVDARPPGFRWLTLYPDGRIDTGVERIAAYPEPMDLQSVGYA